MEKSVLYACLGKDSKNASGDKTIVNSTLVQSMFPKYISKSRKVNRGLCVKIDNLIYGMCRSCAAHFVGVGIMEYNIIDEQQMVGFISTRMPYAATSDRIPIIGQESLIQNLKKLILTISYTLMPAKCVTVTKKKASGPTISLRAMDLFMAYVRKRHGRHVECLGRLDADLRGDRSFKPDVVHALRRGHRPLHERDVH